MKRACLVPVLALISLAFSPGCTQKSVEPASKPVRVRGVKAAVDPAAELNAIHVLDASDHLLFRLEADKRGYEVWGPDRLVARLKVEEDRIKVQDPDGKRLFTLKHKDKKCKAEDEFGATLFALKPHGKGDYKLEDSRGLILYRIKKESYGYKVTDPGDQTLYKMKATDKGVVADGPDGKKFIEVKGTTGALAAAAVGMEQFDLPRRAALFAYLAHFQQGAP